MSDSPENTDSNEIDWLKDFPERSDKLTFPGRYHHIDKTLVRLIRETIRTGVEVHILDFACGPLLHGAPTSVDLAQEIRNQGGKPKVTGIDKEFPPGFSPKDPDIKYSTEMPSDRSQFDVVRVFHVAEHAKDDYFPIRKQLEEKVREGGYLLVTEYLRHIYSNDPHVENYWNVGQVVKVMQKYHGEMRLVTLLPDSGIGWSHDDFFGNFEEARKRIMSGMVKIEDKPRVREFNMFLNNLATNSKGDMVTVEHWMSGADILNFHEFDRSNNMDTLTEEATQMLSKLKLKETEAARYYAKPQKKIFLGIWR